MLVLLQPSGGSIDAAPQSKKPQIPMSAEQRLWQHVLLAILGDLNSSSEQTLRERSFAQRWVGQYPSKDFRMVCDLAGLDPDGVHRHFKRLVETERPNRPDVTRSNRDISTGRPHLNGGAVRTPSYQIDM